MHNFTFSMPKKLEFCFPLSGSSTTAFDLQKVTCIPLKTPTIVSEQSHKDCISIAGIEK